MFFHGPLKVSANDSLLFLGNQGENRQLFIANLPLNASKELTCVCLRCKSPKLTVCDNMKIVLFLA